MISKAKSTIAYSLAAVSMFAMASAASANVQDAMTNAGITGTGQTDGLFEDLTNVVYLLMGVGGIWAVAFVVIGGMLLAGSSGNPQKRGQGIAALATASAGIFVIYKAYDIAGWATGIAN
ncbi:pilin [Planococcus lenghuensis]|nr:pilin [Planococcus lenghuensis]